MPFQTHGNPLGRVIDTPLLGRLRGLAATIATDTNSSPRWIFLVGGPGNGKSETIQDFLTHIDDEMGLGGALTQLLTQRFSPAGILPRKVEVVPSDLGLAASKFQAKIARLVIVQDATATDNALGNAASELANEIADLLTSPDTRPLPVFIACANRGLLARAMNEAFYAFGEANDVTRLLANVIQASSLGRERSAERKRCWPLETDERFACWPLDVESLLLDGATQSAFEQMIVDATRENEWEVSGRCQDCSSRSLCPFRQNAEWLRADSTRRNLLVILRRGELAGGQRWNFRDAFSLAAELLIGQWSDFGAALHPCGWVHDRVASASSASPDSLSSVALLVQLYPHAMFRGSYTKEASRAFTDDHPLDSGQQPSTAGLINALASIGDGGSTTSIRQLLTREYSRLDPAAATPSDPSHRLRIIEDAFCQSVEQGEITAREAPGVSSIEYLVLEITRKAEQEWNLLGRESAIAVLSVCLLRKLAGMMTKRSIGVRLGQHALDEILTEYEACLRDGSRLANVRTALQDLLGTGMFSFNLMEILGQPTAEAPPLISLRGQVPGIRPLPAPDTSDSAPGSDVPWIEVTSPRYRIPLTFDFYMALYLRKNGCAGSSLPASVRAALDRLRHRYAGELCRDDERLLDGRTTISLADEPIGISAPGAEPGPIR